MAPRAGSRDTSGRDPYAILGVARGASAAEVRAAYRALVARYHPDRHQGNPLSDLAAQRMADVNWAYQVLSDAARWESHGARPAPQGGRAGDAAGTGAGGANSPGGPVARARLPRPVKWLALLLAFPLLIRFGAGLARLLAVLARALFEVVASTRGTPLALAGVLALAGLVGFGIVRRRRKRRAIKG